MGYIHAFMTADSVSPSGQEDSGWIDPSWSMTTLFDNRNDAGTLFSVDERDVDLMDYISEAVEGYEDNGDGTFYSVDETIDMHTGVSWTYAIHFKRKYYDTSIHDFIEVPYVPVFPSVLTESTEDVKVFHEL